MFVRRFVFISARITMNDFTEAQRRAVWRRLREIDLPDMDDGAPHHSASVTLSSRRRVVLVEAYLPRDVTLATIKSRIASAFDVDVSTLENFVTVYLVPGNGAAAAAAVRDLIVGNPAEWGLNIAG